MVSLIAMTTLAPGCNAPMDPIDWQWSEVQIPVERIAPESSASQNGASADERSDD